MITQIHFEVLTEECKKQFKKLEIFKEDFYLAGGTSMALQLGHRISVDLDFFSPDPIKKTLLKKVENLFEGSVFKILENSSRELTLIVDGVKYTFLHYPFPVFSEFVEIKELRLLNVEEILSTKAYSIGRRGAIKDYIDMYVGISESYANLNDIIDLASKKFSDGFNDRLFLSQLVFMDDIDEDGVVMLNRKLPTKNEMINFFEKEIKNIVL